MARRMVALVLLGTFYTPLAGQGRGFQPEDYYDIVSVSEVAVSPTGNFVAFTVTTVVEEENTRHQEIWLQPLTNGRPDGEAFRITDPTVESSTPSWSPDGGLLSFSSKRGEDSNAVWFLRVDGPGGEASHIEGVEGTPVWSPTGDLIAYLKVPNSGDKGEDPAGREGWIAPDAITSTLNVERFDGRVITSIRYKQDGVLGLRPHFSVSGKSQLFVVPAQGGLAQRLTELPFDVDSPAWSKDGRQIFFSGDEYEDDELNDENTTDLWAVSVTGGPARRLTTNPGSESNPMVSPDGGRIAFLSSRARGEETDLLVVEIGSDGSFRGEPLNLTTDWDLQPGLPSWTHAGDFIRFSAGIGGNEHLFGVPAAGGRVEQITTGDRRLSAFSFSDNGQVMAFTSTDAATPTELYVAPGDGSTEQKATGFNDAWLRDVTLMPAERLSWTATDGTEVEGWVIKPVGYREGNSYPLILKIHGGPHSAYGNTFFPTFHVLSAAGFFVLYTNPRGSSGYGHAFQYATRGEWGIVDKEDYLAGLDAALARYPDADPGRLGVSGGSYGGFMTNWLTSTTDRFHAAVTSRSITNWESWYGASDAQGLTEFEFFGPPWEQRDLYRRLSPISYVENVTAPTLIIHSENDYRTPISDGEQWFMALKKRGVPVEMVRYPRSSHGLSRTGEPWLLVDRLERIRSWFVHFLAGNRG
ncbi:MAG: S9 family peptidase [Longimicrobiales bacterium]|nr:S9 family peptidase [Longimicrobiales bacterium]